MVEIIAITPEDARCIEACGAGRIELVSAFSEGGLTPSYGIIEKVVKAVDIPVNVMIRPHARGFLYSKEELEIMKTDIAIARELGANGVVLGMLDENEEVAKESLNELLEYCGGLDVTFHRAIDELADIVKGVTLLSNYPQITTVLTSGGKGSITGNIPVIRKMIECSGHIKVMAGGGLNLENIVRMIKETEAAYYHFGTAVRYNSSCFEGIDRKKLEKLVELIAG